MNRKHIYKKLIDEKNLQKGYVTLMSVLILSVVALSISITLIATGITATQNSLTEEAGYEAKYLANACIEEALDEIRTDNLYTGSITLSLATGDCTATVTDIPGTNKRIESEATAETETQRVLVETSQIYPQLVINFWKPVAEF